MMNKHDVKRIYYPYALALDSVDYSHIAQWEIKEINEWLEKNNILFVTTLKDDNGNNMISEDRCSICGEKETCLLCKVVYKS